VREVLGVLTRAQERGFLGPGEIEPHIARALDLAAAIPSDATLLLDLGSGGGLPGLPLALALPTTSWILLEGGLTRAAFLAEAVQELALAERVTVAATRAEEAGRGPLRGAVDVVVARSFGAAAVTAECAAPFLKVGGFLVVAEPPGQLVEGRWPEEGLRRCGLALDRRSDHGTTWQRMTLVDPCPERLPRRNGVPTKRPLF
jgi:16S rRNA (guanine527-N7)-methyltransferase